MTPNTIYQRPPKKRFNNSILTNGPTALLGSCASGKCRFNASRSLSAWPQRIQVVDVWLAFGWLRCFLKIAMGQSPLGSKPTKTMKQCKQHEKPLILKNNPKALHEQLAQLTKRHEDQTDWQSTPPTNQQQNNQPASQPTDLPTNNQWPSIANRPTTPTSNPHPLTTGCQGSNFPGRVNDSHKDPWNFWWHVTGAQETMDAPGVSIPSLFLIYNILILRSLQATLGYGYTFSKAFKSQKRHPVCPGHGMECHGGFQVVMPKGSAPSSATEDHVLIHHIVSRIGEEILQNKSHQTTVEWQVGCNETITCLLIHSWNLRPRTDCPYSAKCPQVNCGSSRMGRSSSHGKFSEKTDNLSREPWHIWKEGS